jgi:hypothetical protein
MEHNEKQAQEFLDRFELTLTATHKGDKCPPWQVGHCTHGDRHRVTIRRADYAENISFDFWNSAVDAHNGKRATPYDVLSCISSDAQWCTDPDEVANEIGDVRPSQAIAIAEFATKLQRFFTRRELLELSEIN